MRTNYVIEKDNRRMVVVVDDATLLAGTIEDRKVFFKETESKTLTEAGTSGWRKWNTMPEEQFKRMTEAMDPDAYKVLDIKKLYEPEEVPSECGIVDGKLQLIPIEEVELINHEMVEVKSFYMGTGDTIEVGSECYFGELYDGDGDVNELLESGAIAVDDKTVDFEIIGESKELETVVRVTDIF